MLDQVAGELAETDWWSPRWLPNTPGALSARFDEACRRWRDLFRVAEGQQATENAVVLDRSRSVDDKARAKRPRAEAEAKMDLLLTVVDGPWRSPQSPDQPRISMPINREVR